MTSDLTHTVANDVAEKLWRFEGTLGAALSEYGELMTALASAPGKTGLSLTFAAGLFDHLPRIGESLVTARSATAPLHKELEVVRRALKITATAPDPSKPDDFVPEARQASLRAVA